MASTITSKEYNGTGSQNTFAYTFQSYQKEDVKVEIDGHEQTQGTHYQIDSYTVSGGTINFQVGGAAATYYNGSSTVTAAPPAGTGNIRVYRDTDITTGNVGEYEAKATYQAGSSIKAADLNNCAKQALYATFELKHQEIQTNKIASGAITTTQIKAGTIVNADIDSAAAIEFTKLENLDSGKILVGNGSNKATEVAVSGDVTIANTGAVTIATGAVEHAMLATDAVESDNIKDGTIVNADINASAAIAGSKLAAATTSVPGSMSAADKTKLDGIEASATADQTNAEIRAAVEAASDSNVFTDADHTKLNGIATGAEVNVQSDWNQSSNSADDFIKNKPGILSLLDEDDFASDDATKPPSQQSTKAYIGTYAQAKDAELTTLAGMQSGTASILASGTALTSTTAELNLLDGKSIVTTISSPTDVQIPTAQAVEERIVDLVTDVGGFKPIANETSFPATNPDPEDNAGTIVSIKALASNLTSNGSGVATIANGAGSGNTVTINGMANNDTIEAGKGILVETTSTLHTYTFHRETLAPADITAAQSAVTDFNQRYQVAGSTPTQQPDGTALAEGDLFFDTAANKMKVYDGSNYGEVTSTGDFKYLFLCPAGGTGAPTINGSIATYDLREGSNSGSAASVTNAAQLIVSVNGVVQKANTGTSAPAEGFAMVDANTIIFGSNLPSGASVFIHQAGSAVSIPTPGDNTVSEVKIQNLAVSTGKIADQAVTLAKLPHGDGTSNGKYLRSNNGADPTWETVSQYSTPLTTRGDLLYRDASGDQRLAKGTDGQFLKIGANDPEWADVIGAVADGCIYENDLTISNNHTIAATKGAHSVGPITVNATVTVNGNWVIS